MSIGARSQVVRAASIAAPLTDLGTRSTAPSLPRIGRILAAFERSAYVAIDDRVIAVLWPGLGRAPFAISLSEPAPLAWTPAGTTVRIEAGRLWIGEIVVDLAGAALWDPSLTGAPVDSGLESKTQDARRVAIDALARLAPSESCAQLVATTEAGASGPDPRLIASLERGLSAIDAYLDGIIPARAAGEVVASDVAGLGPGLTPSGDDVLVGIMHAVTVWPAVAGVRGADELKNLLRDSSAARTTRISGAYLAAAAQGWAAEPWHAFVRSLGTAGDAVRAAATALIEVGETSGADALTGFCWAWRRLAS